MGIEFQYIYLLLVLVRVSPSFSWVIQSPAIVFKSCIICSYHTRIFGSFILEHSLGW